MNRALLFLVFLILFTGLKAQNVQYDLPALNANELQKLASIPELPYSPGDNSQVIPYAVDNSALPFFRPLFQQSGLECGQASSIGLGFTYEINVVRGLPANTSANQYATHFTYNFLNGGADAGVSYFESWEIVKRLGTPTSAEYGGLSYGGPARWMNGYTKYYNAMHNRITELFAISLKTPEGIQTMKEWIYNHTGKYSPGGVGTFYTQYGSVNNTLPAGTPEGGKAVILTWGGSPNHAMTIVGYNDSIRWDFNGDGLYTNTVDINGDGKVDVRDWEIGGFKVANTYGSITNWGNQGFAYAMYKTFAEETGSGGIWNQAAHVVYVKQDLAPKLTYKVTLKHTSRNKLKVIAGVSQNLASTVPEYTLTLPVFDYQGGDKYMQGGTTEADKTLEFGLDATPLLSEIASGVPAKFFLTVVENDPGNTATGQIVDFALINYTSGSVTLPYPSTNIPLVENGTTTLSITATINFNNPEITNTTLPQAKLYQPYSNTMNAAGGNPMYKWKLLKDYSVNYSTAAFPAVTSEILSPTNASSGFAQKTLPFAFPFFGKSYNNIFVHVDGYIMFDDQLLPWPFIIYEKTFFRNTRSIAPYMSKPLYQYYSDGDRIWYQGNSSEVVIRWKMSMYDMAASTDLNFAVKMFPDGRIEFYYGGITSPDYIRWISGISEGDGLNYSMASITDSLVQPVNGTKILFTPVNTASELTLSDDGILSGTPVTPCSNCPLKFYVEDNNNLHRTKTLNFTTKGVQISYQVAAGGDTVIEYGENVVLTAVLKNVGTEALTNAQMKISVNSPFVTVTDSLETVGTLSPGQTVTLPASFAFQVAQNIPDNYTLNIASRITATQDFFDQTTQMKAYAPVVKVESVSVIDGNNNVLMPGESGLLQVNIRNYGGSEATSLNTLLTTFDPYMIISQGAANVASIESGEVKTLSFAISATSGCPNGHIGFFILSMNGDKNYASSDSVYIAIGPIVEDFETGDYTRFPWQLSGSSNWHTSTVLPFEGIYCSESGTLTDNQECSMFLTLNVLAASEVSFYRKVSSETNYDYLYFYLDGVEIAKWSGEVPWGKVTFPVPEGTHIFKWTYRKDYSVSSGSDKAWVDFISWPPISSRLLVAYAGADNYTCENTFTTEGTVVNATTIYWTTSGDGYFSANNSANAVYHPGTGDRNNGSVTLTIHALRSYIPEITDAMLLTILPTPTAFAGPDASVCSGGSYTLNLATTTNQTDVLWTTSGDGTFSSPSYIWSTYTPGPADITTGAVTLTLSAFGISPCNPVADQMILSVVSTVFADAGADQTITYGSFTQLNGTATGGTGIYYPAWEPSSLVLTANSFNPITQNLTASTLFTLTVTDIAGCISSDQMLVTITGGPFSVTATASPMALCLGGTSQLQALAGGGSGVYSYAWTSQPAGFTSSLSNPLVSPSETTVYYVTVTDGANQATANVAVTVNSIPGKPAKPSGPIAVNTLLQPNTVYTSQGSATASSYNWSISPANAGILTPGGNNCSIKWNSAFNGTARLWLTAMNDCGESPASDSLFIVAGVEVLLPESVTSALKLYPNPTGGAVSILSGKPVTADIVIYNSIGQIVLAMEKGMSGVQKELDLGFLSPGYYYLHLLTAEGLQVLRLIKY